MKIKHTPGPWTSAIYRVTESMHERMWVGTLHHAVCADSDPKNPKGLLIAICGDEPGLDSQSAADVRLISQAPEMLSALRAAYVRIAAFERQPGDDWLLKSLDALIAKAGGK